MPVGRRTEPLPTVEDKQPIPTPGPGLRYRKTPIEDDILSSRRGSRMPPGYPGPSAARVEQSADETASSGPSPQAAELRMRVASNESDRLKRIKLDYALQWQKDHSTSPEPRSQEEINSAQPNDSPVAKAEKYINPMQHESEDTIIEGSDAYFFERFRVSRHWSRPVENILKYAAHERRGRRSTATLYDILGISSSSSIAEIKKSFRQRSLLVHPGNIFVITTRILII